MRLTAWRPGQAATRVTAGDRRRGRSSHAPAVTPPLQGRRAMTRTRSPDRLRRLLAASISAGTIAAAVAVSGLPGTAAAADPLLSQGRPTTASSIENAGTPASAATDGNAGTRWASAFSDPQWIQVDLGTTATVTQVTLQWEAAYARAFQIQLAAAAGGPWTTVYSTTTGTGGTQTLAVTGTGRYVRMYGTQRATTYGYSLWELQVRTTGGVPPVGGGGDLGPNVTVFDPSMSTASVQAKLDEIFAAQETAQFGTRRDAVLFKPGRY